MSKYKNKDNEFAGIWFLAIVITYIIHEVTKHG